MSDVEDENEKDMSETELGEEGLLDIKMIQNGLSDCGLSGSSSRKGYAMLKLDLSKKELKSLGTDIEQFKDIEHLNVSNNELTSLEAANQLTFLTSLNAQKNSLTSLADFGSGPTNLQRLQVDFNQIEDLAGFSFPSLKTLTAANNLITAFADVPKENPMQLRALDLSKNIVTSLAGIEVFAELRVLNLNGNKLDSVAGIELLTHLTRLHAGQNQLQPVDLHALKVLPNLTHLVMVGNTLIYEDPEYAENFLSKVLLILPNLQEFDGNKITDEDRQAAKDLKDQQEREAKEAAEAASREKQEAEAAEREAEAADGEGD